MTSRAIIYQWESCTPSRSNQDEQACGVETRLKYASLSSRLEVMQWVNTHSCKTSNVTKTPTRKLKHNSVLGQDGSPGGDRMKVEGKGRIRLETHEPMAII